MKKVLIASSVAFLAFASIAAAQTFSTNLTVGSTGADVVALQTWLIANGYNIPAIASGAAAKGYFGSQTASAVKMYQAAKGIPNTGFVGPLTRAALNGTASVASVPSAACPAGFVCTPVAGTPTTPVVTNPGMITTSGVAGTLAFSLQSTPSNGTSVDKGQSADIVRYKLQAGASDMSVSSVALDFDTRFWLYATSITIKDDSGAVIAQKSGLTQNDFTELTVGTSYRLYVPISNYVVPKAATRYFTVGVTMLPVTDRSAGTLSITKAQVRSVDGTGVTDTQTEESDRSFSYTGSNNGQIILTLDSSSPLQRLVQISTSAETDMVPLAVYSVKSQNKDGQLRSLRLAVRTNGVAGVNTLFNDIKIKAAGLTYSADSIDVSSAGNTTASSTVTFTNLQIPLAKDVYVPITVYGKVAKDTGNALDGAQASTTIVAGGAAGGSSNNPTVEDSTFNATAVNSTSLTSSNAIFSASSVVLSNLSAAATSVGNSSATAYNTTFKFTVTAGDNTVYMSKQLTANSLVSTSTTGTITAAVNTVVADPDTLAGDSSTEYTVPAGSSRTFTISGSITGTTGQSGSAKITAVKYGTTSGSYSQSINYNIGNLQTASVVIP